MPQRSEYGSVTRVGKGVYRVRWWGDAHDGRGYRRMSHTLRNSTRRDARLYLSRMAVEHGEDKPVPTVRRCYEDWYLPDVTGRVSKNSLNNYSSAWRNHVAPRWADTPVTDVRPLAVQQWLSGMTKSQAETACKVLSGVLEFAVRYEVIESNPMRVRYRMPGNRNERDKGVYRLGELVGLWRAVEGSHIEAAFAFAAFGSCRVGESLSPRADELRAIPTEWGEVACFDLVRQIENRGHGPTESLKTAASARPIVLPPAVSARILHLAGDGRVWLSDNGLGEPVGQCALNEEWRRVTGRAGVPHHPFRNLRNSWRTAMEWELGVEPERLEKMMGHVGQTVTARYYNRPDAQAFADTVARAFAEVEF